MSPSSSTNCAATCIFIPSPFDKLVAPVCPDAKLRKLVRNMIYDGVVAQLLSIEMDEIYQALLKQFGKRKAKAAELNWGAAKAGFEYAAKTYTHKLPYRAERMNGTAGKIIIDGNAACALGCMFAGVTVVTWYPITPSSSLVESLIGYMSVSGMSRRPAKQLTPSCKRKMNWRPSEWRWAPVGRARVP